MATTIVLVGCGNMGFALLDGWLKTDKTLVTHVVEPIDSLRQRAAEAGARVVESAEALPADISPDLVVLAVKPQVMADVVPAYVGLAGGRTTFLSVAAGTTISTLAGLLPGPTPIIRCMPNTPAAIGQGMFVCCANDETSEAIRTLTTSLLATAGEVDWIEDEELMDAVTAVSGSGPAYVFHMIECLAAAGEDVGLPSDLALRMASQTVMGAGQLAASASVGPGKLREQVTSPGGTTAAGLGVLMAKGALPDLMKKTVRAARDRGRELAET